MMRNQTNRPPAFSVDSRHLGRTSTTALIVAACLGLASAMGCTATAAPTPNPVAPEPTKRTDSQINNALEGMLLTDSALSNNPIDVRTSEGIVTLTGTTDTLMAKERAAKVAETLRGVRGVVNTLYVQVTTVPNDVLRKDVESALRYDAATTGYAVKPEARDGVVTLSGTVHSYLEKQLAVNVAKEVRGVKEVKDDLAVTIKGERSDTEIAAEIKRTIGTDAWLNRLITADVKDGTVTLTGEVGSSAQYERASLLAWSAGVKAVKAEGLKIEPWAKKMGQRSEMIAVKSDADIKLAVQDAFAFDPRVSSFNPMVEVMSGGVTLTGVVDNLRAKRAAAQDARNTVGIGRLQNLLKVRPVTPLADDQIVQNLKFAFGRDSIVAGYQIDAKAKRGVVTLTGTVDSYYDKVLADNVASRAIGVVDVTNNLTVNRPAALYYDIGGDPYWSLPSYYSYYDPSYSSSWAYTGDETVKQAIEDELYWSPFVHRDQVVVKVDNGVATLTGTVDSWFASNRATEKAYEGGARQVHNNLKVS